MSMRRGRHEFMAIPVPAIDESDCAIKTLKFPGDGNRLRILKSLSRRKLCVCELIEQIGMPQPPVSYHLLRLREAGLVRTRRKAQWVYNSIDLVAWRSLVSPLMAGYLVTEFPPEAVLGASDWRDTVPPTRSSASWRTMARSRPSSRPCPGDRGRQQARIRRV